MHLYGMKHGLGAFMRDLPMRILAGPFAVLVIVLIGRMRLRNLLEVETIWSQPLAYFCTLLPRLVLAVPVGLYLLVYGDIEL